MKRKNLSDSIARLAATVLFGMLGMSAAQAGSPNVQWERIDGIVPHPDAINAGILPGQIEPVAFPWSVDRGRAQFDVRSNRLTFDVNGLSMGGSFRIGTTGIVTMVKGTIVCRLTGQFVDSPAVPLSKNGNAAFAGRLYVDVPCDAEDVIFVLRVAEVENPSVPQIQDRWLAHGAARRIQNDD